MRCNTTCTDELGELGVYCTIAINRVPPPSRYHSLMASDTVSIVGPDEFDPEFSILFNLPHSLQPIATYCDQLYSRVHLKRGELGGQR